jgi:hypothetical protein
MPVVSFHDLGLKSVGLYEEPLKTACRRWGTDLVETASEAAISFRAVIPFFIHDTEGNILVRRPCNKTNQTSIFLSSRGERFSSFPTMLPNDLECWCLRFVNQVRIENIELVSLNDFGWWIVMVIMSLVILVPLISHLDAIEVARLSRSIFVCPLWFRSRCDSFLCSEDLLILVDATSDLSLIQSFCCL